MQDPAANAKAVGRLLDGGSGPDYIQKALDCFGVAVTKTDQGWDAVPSTTDSSNGQSRTYGVNPYDSAYYDQASCTNSSDSNWLRIRFWIMDTGTMESYACVLGDDQSCDDDSFSSGTPTTAVSGSAFWLSADTANIPWKAEFDNLWDQDTDPATGFARDWVSSDCGEFSLASVLNYYGGRSSFSGASVPGNPTAPFFRIIDTERVGVKHGWWGSSPTGGMNGIQSVVNEANYFGLHVTVHDPSTSYSGADNPRDYWDFDKIVTAANNGTPVIVTAPNHYFVVWGGDLQNGYAYALDSSANNFTYAPAYSSDSITITQSGNNLGSAAKWYRIPKDEFMHTGGKTIMNSGFYYRGEAIVATPN